jgi:hypothetical protein
MQHSTVGDAVKKLVLITLALTVFVLSPATAAAQAPLGDSVVGESFDDRETEYATFRVDAHSGPAGQNPTGTAYWHVGLASNPQHEVDVSCLAVSGNTAVVGYSGRLIFSGIHYVAGFLRVVDGGGEASGQDSWEWATTGSASPTPVAGPTDCSAYPDGQPGSSRKQFNRSGGDLVVTDTTGPRQQARQECIFIRAAHGRPAFRAWYGTGADKRYAMPNCVNERSSS